MENIEWDDLIPWILGVGIAGLLALLVWLSIQENKAWQVYAKQHHCVSSGTKKGQTHVGFGSDSKGNPVTTISTDPDQTIYTCDNGEIQIR